jgi:agmatinase
MIDQTKLSALRKRFANGAPDDVADPDFRRALGLAFKGGRRALPYAGVSTLLDAPYLPDALELPDAGGLQVVLLGVPMDLGVTNRSGARLGPRAVRAIERIGP